MEISIEILKAVEFAAEKHKNQKRKGNNSIPYINHCIQVANMIAETGKINDREVLIAALLHDTIEDTKTKEHEILELFGQEVLDLVLEVSDDKTLPKMVRKQLQIDNAPKKSTKAKLIKIADKTCNIRDIILNAPTDWTIERKTEYLDWAEKVVISLRGTNQAMEDIFDHWLVIGRKKFGINT